MCPLDFFWEFNDPVSCLRTDQTGIEFKLEFSDIRLIVPRVHVKPELLLSVERRLAQSPCNYVFKHTSAREFIIPTNTLVFRREDVFQGSFLPEECLVVLIANQNIVGSLSTSIIDFRPHNIDDLFFEFDATRYPTLKMDADWTSPTKFNRPFADLYSNYGSWTDLG